jgi:hypothetical protein
MRLLDANGTVVEEGVFTPRQAQEKAAQFILLHGADPEESGRGAKPGSVEFEPYEATSRLVQARILVGLAVDLDLSEDALDDAVYDLAQEVELDTLNSLEGEDEQEEHIAAREALASGINNQGFETQIDFLLQLNSPEEVERLIRDTAGPGE